MNIKRVDALIMINFALSSNPEREQMREMFELFNERHYPYVVINREPGEEKMPKIPLIRVDNASGMRQVAEFIVRKQYATVGFAGELTPNPQLHHLERRRLLAEYLDGSQAVLVDLNRDVPAQLAFAIEMLRDHPDLRAEMGRAGAKTAKRFSVETYYNNLVRILADLGERV